MVANLLLPLYQAVGLEVMVKTFPQWPGLHCDWRYGSISAHVSMYYILLGLLVWKAGWVLVSLLIIKGFFSNGNLCHDSTIRLEKHKPKVTGHREEERKGQSEWPPGFFFRVNVTAILNHYFSNQGVKRRAIQQQHNVWLNTGLM